MTSSVSGFGVRQSLRALLVALPSGLHWIFLLFAVPMVIFLAVRTPAFQTPDEVNHFFRSYQVAHGVLFAREGGYTDSAIDDLYTFVAKLPFNPRARLTAAEVTGARRVRWSGRVSYHSFPNTAAYFPADYIPQALGILIGQAFGLGVLNTLILARLLNGVTAIIICAFALASCGRGKLMMFALLLLPMTLSLFASCSQDATLIAFACVAFSLISRQLEARTPMTNATAAVVFGAILIIALGRPPQAALALAFFIPGMLPCRSKTRERLTAFVLMGFTVTITLAWWIAGVLGIRSISQSYQSLGPPIAPADVDPKMQLINLLHHPGIIGDLLIYAVNHRTEYIAQFIGCLGWLDTVMPALYYLAMILVFALAAIAEMGHGRAVPRVATALILGASFVSIVGVFFIQYLISTPVGQVALTMQGRYFTPIVIAAAAGLPSLGNSSRQTYELAAAIVVLAQLITVAVLPHVIMARYYMG
jgi:uncharacterized membrane protein